MLSNTSSNNFISQHIGTSEFVLIAYYPLFLIIIGTILNTNTFIVLCRSPFRDTKKQPAMHYMRTMAIFDILILYGWNLDHYLSSVHGFKLLIYSIPSCKWVNFLSFSTTQISAWLRVFVCFDRYLSLSRLSRTWFSKSKTILIIIALIISIFLLLNFHLLLFACYIDADGNINPNAVQYTIYPMWDRFHLVLYNCLPFILMVIFDSGVIYHLIHLRRRTTLQNSRIQHRSISITLVVTSTLFLIMTIPSGVVFAFFLEISPLSVPKIVDGIYFTYHILSFPLYMITFTEFRREFIGMIYCAQRDRVVPVNNPAFIPPTTAATFRLKTVATVATN